MDDNNGKDVAVHRMNCVVGVVDFIDSIGQIHLKGYGLAINPDVDEFVLQKTKNRSFVYL